MCRWLAYAGDPLQISRVVLDTKHSLAAQSLNSPLGAETVNGDGFGLGWYAADGALGSRPAVFHSIEPAWHDENLREIAQAVESPLFFAHVRAAAGPPIQQTNCHPFRYGNWLFMHNGGLAEFAAIKRELVLEVAPEYFVGIRGTTDSEVVFALALTYGLMDGPIEAMAATLRRIEEIAHRHGVDQAVQGTFAVTDGSSLWAFRYSSAHRSRTLYHSEDIEVLREMYPGLERLQVFGTRARLVVSEPLSDLPGAFIEVPESTAVIIGPDGGYRHEPFLAG
jgi:predicted glutamine amidotransferase